MFIEALFCANPSLDECERCRLKNISWEQNDKKKFLYNFQAFHFKTMLEIYHISCKLSKDDVLIIYDMPQTDWEMCSPHPNGLL